MKRILIMLCLLGSGGGLLHSAGIMADDVALVKDINPGFANSFPNYLTNFNGILMFSASDHLWKSDGTALGTSQVNTIIPRGYTNKPDFTKVNNILFFVAEDGTHGNELWKTDSTEAGTALVKDIWSGNVNSDLQELTNVNGVLFFVANDGSHGNELWKSDGTEAGTILVKDIVTGSSSSNPKYLTNVNGLLYFYAYDPTNGFELWKSDGTTVGTVLVKDIYPGSTGSDHHTHTLAEFNGLLYFGANDGINGFELWRSDGTAPGTVLVKDFNSGTFTDSQPSCLTNVNGVLFFRTYINFVDELWKSDGTAAGTIKLTSNIFSTGSPNAGSPIDRFILHAVTDADFINLINLDLQGLYVFSFSASVTASSIFMSTT